MSLDALRNNTNCEKWGYFFKLEFQCCLHNHIYVLLSPDGKILNSAVQYTDRDTYKEWVKNRVSNF